MWTPKKGMYNFPLQCKLAMQRDKRAELHPWFAPTPADFTRLTDQTRSTGYKTMKQRVDSDGDMDDEDIVLYWPEPSHVKEAVEVEAAKSRAHG